MSGTIAALVLALGGLLWIALPLLRAGSTEPALGDESLSRSRELQSRRDMLLAALRDLEDDHATDKVDEEDYGQLKTRLSSEAIEVLRQLDDEQELREEQARRPPAKTLRHPGARRPGTAS